MSARKQASSSLRSTGVESRSKVAVPGASSAGAAAPQRSAVEDKQATASTSTQRVIRNILRAGPLDLQIQQLAKMEVRPLPPNASADRRERSRSSRTCCFDAVNKAWTCNKLCARCMLYNQLLREQTQGNKSETVKGILNTVFYCTDCVSETERTGETQTLPHELLGFVVKYAISEMRRTKESKLVRLLLHLSRETRCKVVKAFTPIRLFELQPCAAHSDRLRTPKELHDFIWDSIHWHFFQDFSHKPPKPEVAAASMVYGSRAIKPAPVIGEWLDSLTTVENHRTTYVYISIELSLYAPASYPGGKRMSHNVWCGTGQIGYDLGEARVNVRDACEAVELAIGHVLEMQAERNSLWVHFANPYFRALQGTLASSRAALGIEVACWLHDKGQSYTPPDDIPANKNWSFEPRMDR